MGLTCTLQLEHQREVSPEEGASFARRHGCMFQGPFPGLGHPFVHGTAGCAAVAFAPR